MDGMDYADEYMFLPGVFGTPTAKPSPSPPIDISPMNEPVYTSLENIDTALKFHPALKNPGRPKRSLQFGSPTTPYSKRSKLLTDL